MLLNLHKKKWTDGLTLQPFDTHSKTNEDTVKVGHLHLDCHLLPEICSWHCRSVVLACALLPQGWLGVVGRRKCWICRPSTIRPCRKKINYLQKSLQ